MNSTARHAHPAPCPGADAAQPPGFGTGGGNAPAPTGNACSTAPERRGRLHRIAGALLRASEIYASLARNHPMK